MSRNTALHMNWKRFGHVYITGFFGGLFTAALFLIFRIVGFLPVGPEIIWRIILAPYALEPAGWTAHIGGLLIICLFSVLAAFLFYVMLRKFVTPWVGVGFGVALWLLIFFGVNPMLPHVQTVRELGWQVNIVYLSLFVLYGLFTGYSISYEWRHAHQNDLP